VGISCIFGERKNKIRAGFFLHSVKPDGHWSHWLVCLAWAFIPIKSADRGGFTLHIIIKQQQQPKKEKKKKKACLHLHTLVPNPFP
jgi:hypothetical protein